MIFLDPTSRGNDPTQFERAMMQGRVQSTFTALLSTGMVRFGEVAAVPAGKLDLIPLSGPPPFHYTGIVFKNPLEDGLETFYVARARPDRKINGTKVELAGPFTTGPVAPTPADSGTPLQAMLSIEDLLRGQKPIRLPVRSPTPLELPPSILGAGRFRDGAVVGFQRGFADPSHGARLAA
jgi:hypothetical protein